jgi:hypothetical protein
VVSRKVGDYFFAELLVSFQTNESRLNGSEIREDNIKIGNREIGSDNTH